MKSQSGIDIEMCGHELTVYNNDNHSFLYNKTLELKQCAQSWEPNALLIGNVKASEIEVILKDYLRLKLAAGI